uniref:Uncharacterized protein n=1 Tax=Anguilla anguilla TaxID=7936 RepID=A0A0E9PRU3_ANGAN
METRRKSDRKAHVTQKDNHSTAASNCLSKGSYTTLTKELLCQLTATPTLPGRFGHLLPVRHKDSSSKDFIFPEVEPIPFQYLRPATCLTFMLQ